MACGACKRHLHFRSTDLTVQEIDLVKATKSVHLLIFCKLCRAHITSFSELTNKLLIMQKSIDDRLSSIEKIVLTTPITAIKQEELIQESVERALRVAM